MTECQLEGFRTIAAMMQTGTPDWQWIGPFMSQRMFGITEQRAKEYAARHGGEAKKMEPVRMDDLATRIEKLRQNIEASLASTR